MAPEENRGKLYADRAMGNDEPLHSPAVTSRIKEARDMVYNGAATQVDEPGTDVPAGTRNRRGRKRKISPFHVILMLLSTAIVSVVYISNVLAVGRLYAEIEMSRKKHQQMIGEQELLRAQMEKLSNFERIQQLAQTQLSMRVPTEHPYGLTVNHDRVQQLQEVIQAQQKP